jgi:hypothetical protein
VALDNRAPTRSICNAARCVASGAALNVDRGDQNVKRCDAGDGHEQAALTLRELEQKVVAQIIEKN